MVSAQSTTPRITAALSRSPDTTVAAREVCHKIKTELTASPHLAVVFASFHHQADFERLAEILRAELGTDCLLGCTGESIVCGDQEIEGEPALALWVAHLPGVRLLPMHLRYEQTAEGGAFVGWPEVLQDSWPAGSSLLLLAEPYTFP